NTYLSVREPAQVVACFICLGHGGFDVLNAYYHGVEIVLGRQLEACIGQRSGKSACHSVGPLSYFSDAFGAVVYTVHCCHNRDRKSTRLNSSHVSISYAVFCLKKKKNH